MHDADPCREIECFSAGLQGQPTLKSNGQQPCGADSACLRARHWRPPLPAACRGAELGLPTWRGYFGRWVTAKRQVWGPAAAFVRPIEWLLRKVILLLGG
jgi:hypothetical protein